MHLANRIVIVLAGLLTPACLTADFVVNVDLGNTPGGGNWNSVNAAQANGGGTINNLVDWSSGLPTGS